MPVRTNKLIEMEVTTEHCPKCDSRDIRLFTPNDENKYSFFQVDCNFCSGNYIVDPSEGLFYTLKAPKEVKI